ncbi:MAG: hypothetical protein CVT79_16665 [Alphaproteobacteria bacterium HGW-Alphaproteobacteria-18]|nr:MAG: hypothetical protein CVT79_16665 [Alphaproteobacteria bacterium HGW-Alphaproteobacteria-18]
MLGEGGFEGEIVLTPPVNTGAPETLAPLTAKFVHYPGSQQLILWLPQDGYSGYSVLRIHGPGGTQIENTPLTERLNGRVQILIDTWPWPPGPYHIEITHKEGWRHELALEKLEAGIAPPPPAPPVIEERPGPIVYRDSAGTLLPDLDLELREREFARLAARFARRLEFEGNARAGTITYIEGDLRLRFSHEMGRHPVHFSIDIPPPEKWETATGRPLAERDDILEFLAAETRRLQASRWNFVIHADRIDFVD